MQGSATFLYSAAMRSGFDREDCHWEVCSRMTASKPFLRKASRDNSGFLRPRVVHSGKEERKSGSQIGEELL